MENGCASWNGRKVADSGKSWILLGKERKEMGLMKAIQSFPREGSEGRREDNELGKVKNMELLGTGKVNKKAESKRKE